MSPMGVLAVSSCCPAADAAKKDPHTIGRITPRILSSFTRARATRSRLTRRTARPREIKGWMGVVPALVPCVGQMPTAPPLERIAPEAEPVLWLALANGKVPSVIPSDEELGTESRTLRQIDRLLRAVPGARTDDLPLGDLVGREAAAVVAAHRAGRPERSEEHTSELQSLRHLVCRL